MISSIRNRTRPRKGAGETKENSNQRMLSSSSEEVSSDSDDGESGSGSDSDDSSDDEEEIVTTKERIRRGFLWLIGRPYEPDAEIELGKLGTVEVYRREFFHHLDWFGFEEIKHATGLGKKFGMSLKQIDSFVRAYYELDNTRRGSVGVKQLCLHLSLPRTPLMDWVLGYAPHRLRARLSLSQALLRVYLFCTMSVEELIHYQVECVFQTKRRTSLKLAEVVGGLLELNYGLVHGEQAQAARFALSSPHFRRERAALVGEGTGGGGGGGGGPPLTSAAARRGVVRTLLFFPVLAYPALRARRALQRRFLSPGQWAALAPGRRDRLRLNAFFADRALDDNAPPTFYDEKVGARGGAAGGEAARGAPSRRRRRSSVDRRLLKGYSNLLEEVPEEPPNNINVFSKTQKMFFGRSFRLRRDAKVTDTATAGDDFMSESIGRGAPRVKMKDPAMASQVQSSGRQNLSVDILEDPNDRKLPRSPGGLLRGITAKVLGTPGSVLHLLSRPKKPKVEPSSVFEHIENSVHAWTITATSIISLVYSESFAGLFKEGSWGKFLRYYRFTLEHTPSDEALSGLRAGWIRPQNLRNLGYSIYTVAEPQPKPLWALDRGKPQHSGGARQRRRRGPPPAGHGARASSLEGEEGGPPPAAALEEGGGERWGGDAPSRQGSEQPLLLGGAAAPPPPAEEEGGALVARGGAGTPRNGGAAAAATGPPPPPPGKGAGGGPAPPGQEDAALESLARRERGRAVERARKVARMVARDLRGDSYGDKFIDFLLLVSGLLRDEEHMARLRRVLVDRAEPADLPFWEELDDDLREREFYYNMRTGEPRWIIPEALRLWRIEQERKKMLHIHIW